LRRLKILRIAALIASALLLEGCYYFQAARGQMELLRRRQPIDELITDNTIPVELRDRLVLVSDARRFAVDALSLPDNDSYRSYADLERDFVVWNVVAAPEFSLEPKQWCYPVAGCVAYRGYFAEESARKMASKLESQGFDVMVGGVPAYSTLGRFADPVLNTMMRWSDEDLVATLFHELAHQVVYVKDDSQFNESFATTVAQTGLERWREYHGQEGLPEHWQGRRRASAEFVTRAISTREKLETLYASGLDESTMRERKQAIFQDLANDAKNIADRQDAVANPFVGTLNNARLALISVYEGRVTAFESLLRECDGNLACFYREAERLAKLDKEARERKLDELADSVAPVF
jgi:predicted aminopeptidase